MRSAAPREHPSCNECDAVLIPQLLVCYGMRSKRRRTRSLVRRRSCISAVISSDRSVRGRSRVSVPTSSARSARCCSQHRSRRHRVCLHRSPVSGHLKFRERLCDGTSGIRVETVVRSSPRDPSGRSATLRSPRASPVRYPACPQAPAKTHEAFRHRLRAR